MIRGFVTGVLWGVLVAGIGLVVVSQLAPPPRGAVADLLPAGPAAEVAPDATSAPDMKADPAATPVADPEIQGEPEAVEGAAPPLTAEPAVVEPAATETAPAETAAAEPATAEPAPAEMTEADPAAAIAAGTAPPATPLTEPPAAAQSPSADLAPQPPVQDTPAGETDLASQAAASQPAPPMAEPIPAAPSEPNPLPDATGDVLLEPGSPAPSDVAPVPPQPDGTAIGVQVPALPDAAAADAAPADGLVDPPPAAAAEPGQEAARLLIDDQPDTLPATGTIGNRAEGVTTGRLPSIGTDQVAAPVEAAEDDLPPLRRYARQFDGAEGKPLFVILLRDIGAAGMARDSLTTLPFPVTFVVDPAAPDAAVAAAAYRAAGQEVLMLATGIPPGAQPSDLEQTFQSLATTLPEAVGVVDLPEGGFQDDRALASQVVPILMEQGRGLVTYDQGLNAADQVARREGVAATTIFRRLDAAGEDTTVVRRYLDRAAFRAAQEGQVVVIGDTRAETVAALLEWTVEGRAASVTMAPVTAVLVAE